MSERIYLDTSVYNRQFDDQTQPRIWLETQAISLIMQMVENRVVVLISSSVINYENSRNPFDVRRDWVSKVLLSAQIVQMVDETIRLCGLTLEQQGFKAIDALHFACAEAAQARFFVTCDDRLLRRYGAITARQLRVCSPVEFIEDVTGEQ